MLGAAPSDVKYEQPNHEQRRREGEGEKEAAVNLPVGETRRKLVKFCALSEGISLQEWCIRAIDEAIQIKTKGKRPFDTAQLVVA